jgi:hypothetical protein
MMQQSKRVFDAGEITDVVRVLNDEVVLYVSRLKPNMVGVIGAASPNSQANSAMSWSNMMGSRTLAIPEVQAAVCVAVREQGIIQEV